MNPLDQCLNRLLRTALQACPPPPSPSPWFEQRMLEALRNTSTSLGDYLDSILAFRVLAVATVIMAICVALPLFQTTNPYRETLAYANSLIQTEHP